MLVQWNSSILTAKHRHISPYRDVVFGFMNMGLDFTWHCLLDSLNITLFSNSKANWCSMILTPFLLFYIWAFCSMKTFSYLGSNYVCEHEWCFPHWENRGETSGKWWLWYWWWPKLCQCLSTLLVRKPNLLSGTIWSIATSSTSKGS